MIRVDELEAAHNLERNETLLRSIEKKLSNNVKRYKNCE